MPRAFEVAVMCVFALHHGQIDVFADKAVSVPIGADARLCLTVYLL